MYLLIQYLKMNTYIPEISGKFSTVYKIDFTKCYKVVIKAFFNIIKPTIYKKNSLIQSGI